jgi:hypothetical protein
MHLENFQELKRVCEKLYPTPTPLMDGLNCPQHIELDGKINEEFLSADTPPSGLILKHKLALPLPLIFPGIGLPALLRDYGKRGKVLAGNGVTVIKAIDAVKLRCNYPTEPNGSYVKRHIEEIQGLPVTQDGEITHADVLDRPDGMHFTVLGFNKKTTHKFNSNRVRLLKNLGLTSVWRDYQAHISVFSSEEPTVTRELAHQINGKLSPKNVAFERYYLKFQR